MVTAEKWYEGHENYKKYGIDMRPEPVTAAKPRKSQQVSAKDRFRLILFAVIVGFLGICIIVSGAYSASLKYEINNMLAENTEIKREIETLNVELQMNVNIATIEEKALNELGMVYPDPTSIVYLQEEAEAPVSDFAMLLKEEAYN